MKPITFITTTANCIDDTFDKITHLNAGFHQPHFTNSIIVLRGNFVPDVFEYIESDKMGGTHTWWRKSLLDNGHAEITEDRYDEMHEVLPPLYLSHIDGEPIKRGMACSEAYNHFDGTVVLTTCYMKGGKYYECLCVVYKNNDKPISDTYNDCWTKDNYGITYKK